uniref:Lipoprotein n=1 Tax=Strongyloides stercoralis TaxID=6248 RepID=A0A0K0DTZ8_STRER
MLKKFKFLIILITIISPTHSCNSISGGGGISDGEIIQNPTFSFKVSPAVSWTYPPEISSPNPGVVFYFPGQSLSQNQALQRAKTDINAALLFAFDDENIPVTRLETTITYSPDPIANCVQNVPIPSGTYIGLLASGAIIEWTVLTGTSGGTVTLTNCPLSMNSISTSQVLKIQDYIKEINISIQGYTTTRGVWRTIANNLMAILNFRYSTLVRSEITIN